MYPAIVVHLLFGAEIAGEGAVMSRVAGIALIVFGLACWPGSEATGSLIPALRAMLCYSLLAALYLAYLGIVGEWIGTLRWPAVNVIFLITDALGAYGNVEFIRCVSSHCSAGGVNLRIFRISGCYGFRYGTAISECARRFRQADPTTLHFTDSYSGCEHRRRGSINALPIAPNQARAG